MVRDPQAYEAAKERVFKAQELLGEAVRILRDGSWNETADDIFKPFDWLNTYTHPTEGMFYYLERPDPDEGEA